MITVQNDWIEYDVPERPVPVRAVAVRGGAACARRAPIAPVRPVSAAPAVRSVVAVRAVPAGPTPALPAVPRPAPAARAPKSRLRLTRRGRFVLVVLPALLVATTALVTVAGPLAQAAPERQPAARTVVVHAGDSLWSIAQRVAPTRDPRDVVATLERVNALPDAGIRAGQAIAVPADLLP
ncbi:LysM peptidoglycan-binding domain-containing protein [Amnibacterium sp. CER49]|uniref:LysM peptidoglycan-binding domain-containing protein n=1 Tax=Amnibacterium sp. CER49 TaxID=3039161 RepID=UPI0024490096|nr:LysM peptidoglycan-binding domain-containing protein [Amnibacterium sp. CER49]MDH2444985.1 LysM peptidoglycan-binding domain-containing protein [Amnibacterium sp. CER49]